MQPQLPVEPTIQDAWMQAFANATRGVREIPQRLDYFARQKLGPGTYSDINKNIKDIFDAPSPIGWEDDAVKGLGAMVINPKTIGLFQKLLDKNLATFERRAVQGIPWKGAGLNEEGLKALAFLKTRYPSVVNRAMRKVNEVASASGSYYDPRTNVIGLGEYDNPTGNVGGLLHEIRHLFQEKVPRYPRGKDVLGIPDKEKTLKISRDVEFAKSALDRSRALEDYEQLPYELDPTRAGALGRNAYNLYQNLLNKYNTGNTIPTMGTFKPQITPVAPIRNWDDLANYFGIKK